MILYIAHHRQMPLAEAMAMDQEELLLLAAWYEDYGPDRRDDYRAGKICSVMAGLQGVDRKPEDFFPSLRVEAEPQRPMTTEEKKSWFKAWAKSLKGRFRKRKSQSDGV